MGLPLRGVRVFKQVPWLKADSVKVASPRPAHQRVKQAVGRQVNLQCQEELNEIMLRN